MKILVTGFEPFSTHSVNPSQKIVEALFTEKFLGVDLQTLVLPVDHVRAPGIITETIRKDQPDAILAFGLASSRFKIGLERVAINLMDFKIPDNSGTQIVDQLIVEKGPAAYFTTLPARSLLPLLQEEGIPVEISLTAGSYLCNLVFYTMMHEISLQAKPIQAGFIHLPALPEEAAKSDKTLPSLSLELDLNAARIMINYLAQNLRRN